MRELTLCILTIYTNIILQQDNGNIKCYTYLHHSGAVVTAEEKVCSSFCSSLGMLQSSPGKSCADIYQINKASRRVSGLYWINTTSGLHQVNCDMELECGGHKGGWTTTVKLDTSKGDSCPSGWTKITTSGDLPKVVCRSGNDAGGCYSAIFTTYNITLTRSVVKLKVTKKEILLPFVQLRMILNQSMITMYTAWQ